MRRRIDSDSCGGGGGGGGSATASPLLQRHHVLGEPGCFSSPIHQPRQRATTAGAMGLGAAIVSQPSSQFASPARSISSVVSTIADCGAADDGDVDDIMGDMPGDMGVDEMMQQAAASAAVQAAAAASQPTITTPAPALPAAEMEQPLQGSDQTVVSGWLKFRDNKRVSGGGCGRADAMTSRIVYKVEPGASLCCIYTQARRSVERKFSLAGSYPIEISVVAQTSHKHRFHRAAHSTRTCTRHRAQHNHTCAQ